MKHLLIILITFFISSYSKAEKIQATCSEMGLEIRTREYERCIKEDNYSIMFGFFHILYISLGNTIKEVPSTLPTLDPETGSEKKFKNLEDCEKYLIDVILPKYTNSVLKIDKFTFQGKTTIGKKYLTNQSHVYQFCKFFHEGWYVKKKK